MYNHSVFFKALSSFILCLGLFACSAEPDPKAEAQKRLEAEAKEIQAKAQAKFEFKEKNCKDKSYVECQKLMQEAGLVKKDKDFRLN